MTGVKAIKNNWGTFLKETKDMHIKNRKKVGEPQHVALQQWDDVSSLLCFPCLSCLLQFIENYYDGRRPSLLSWSSSSGGVQDFSIRVFLTQILQMRSRKRR